MKKEKEEVHRQINWTMTDWNETWWMEKEQEWGQKREYRYFFLSSRRVTETDRLLQAVVFAGEMTVRLVLTFEERLYSPLMDGCV